MGHHKTNREVEGNPDTRHGGGMPRRPDEVELERRTQEDRRDLGLNPDAGPSAEAQYEEAQAAVDRAVERGEDKSADTTS
ncbi:hypothetical protein [Streptomyces sp. Da 82-17]|uniref:hypothetical protein n=1 Tax=Streptomyces sp. Da 82-17 TaxID=3377116 RepID=UPI0038D40988